MADKYPDGKINQDDEGELELKTVVYEGRVIMVRNGFVPLVRREVANRFKGLEIDTCPFANLPEKKRTQWALTRKR